MTCEVCGRCDPEGKSIETLRVDVAHAFGLPEQRLMFVINHCHKVRHCEYEANRMAGAFVERHGIKEDNR